MTDTTETPNPSAVAVPSPEPEATATRQALDIPAAEATPPPGPNPLHTAELPGPFTRSVIAALKTVYDPEIPVDIFELGLIYKIDVADNQDVAVEMTLTAPGCPIAGEMPVMVEEALKTVEGIGQVTVTMTFDPPWTPEKMSEEARVALNMF